MSKKQNTKKCPCGSGKAYPSCCEPYINGTEIAPNPEALMRSRFTAYAQLNEAYVLASWHASTRPNELNLHKEPIIKWTRLKIIDSSDNRVEFIAVHKVNGKAHKLHERSQFIQEQGRWFYVDGDVESLNAKA